MTLFERVKNTAKSKGFSLAELARRASIGEKSIYTWKPTKQFPDGIEPKRETLEKVADVLGVSVDYLLGETDIPTPRRTQSDVDIDKALDNAVTYEGNPLSDHDKNAIRAYIKTYMSGKE